jgi:D-proline reductase (dithiol) PrdE
LDVVTKDTDVNLVGIIIVGTPQSNDEKFFVGQRVAVMVEAMQCKGGIISVDGWGNSHVDYANTIEEIGKREIAVVGLSFIGVQGEFVTTNKYMDTIVDFNKSQDGIETQVVGENNTCELDAKKALALLKLKMRKGGAK